MFKSINSSSNPYIKHLCKIRKDRKYRDEQKKLLITGKNVILEIEKKLEIDTLIYSDDSRKKKIKAKNYLKVTSEILKKITGLESPEDIAILIDMPNLGIKKKERVLILDNISDPGNLGTLIRSANGLFFDLVILSKGSCDPFNDKSLRATKGAVFYIPIVELEYLDIEKFIKENKLHTYLASLEGENIKKVIFEKPTGLILGNEAKGISSSLKNIGKKIKIEMKSSQESLNVATSGSILMYKITELF